MSRPHDGRPVPATRPTIEPETMRRVLGHFASGVTVVTGVGHGAPVGFTCQSFTSLSLDPPLVLIAPSRSSTTWPVLRAAGGFCVNVLAENHESLSATFARSGTDKFAGVGWQPSPSGHPLLPGVAAWIDCALHAEFDGGDHTLVVAAVTGLGADDGRVPLLFHRGSYSSPTPLRR